VGRQRCPLTKVQAYAGHRDVKTRQRYVHHQTKAQDAGIAPASIHRNSPASAAVAGLDVMAAVAPFGPGFVPVSLLLELLDDEFRAQVEVMGGYSTAETGLEKPFKS
jgi:glycine cleavage system protein P-like pyridoxal-binding family